MQPRATAIVSVDRDHVAGELRTRADDMRGGLRRQDAQAREALRTLLVDRFDFAPVLVAGTRGYAFTGDGTFGGLLAASTCLGALCRLISVASSYSFSRQPGERWAKMRVSLASPKWHSICARKV